MQGKSFCCSGRRDPVSPAWMTRLRGPWKAGLVAVLSALCLGCPPEGIPPQTRPGPALPHSVPQAQQLLKETLLRSLSPQIVEAEVTDDFVTFRSRQAVAGFATGAPLEARIALLNIGRVDAFANNVVQIWTPSNLLLVQLLFGNYQDPRACADLLLFLRDRRAGSGGR